LDFEGDRSIERDLKRQLEINREIYQVVHVAGNTHVTHNRFGQAYKLNLKRQEHLDIDVVAKILYTHKHFEYVSLSWNKIDDAKVKKLVHAI